jgi:hypothetical protein
MVLTPFFLGAESNYADVAPFADTNVSENEESAGLPRAWVILLPATEI